MRVFQVKIDGKPHADVFNPRHVITRINGPQPTTGWTNDEAGF